MFGAMKAAPIPDSTVPRVALRWQWSRLPELAPEDLYAALAARQQVFAVEQACAFQDADGYDLPAWHLLGWTTDAAPSRAAPLATSLATSLASSLVTYLRVLDPGSKYAEPSIGRVLTVPPWRRVGIGRVVMQEGIARCQAAWPGQPIRIAAQQRLEAFYASLAFRVASPPYIEDGIPHVDMILAGQ
jgi:ElaA protein